MKFIDDLMEDNIYDNSNEEEMDFPDSYENITEYEIWLHDEICMREDIFLGEFLGIFSNNGKFIKRIYIPLRTHKNNSDNLIDISISHNLTEEEKDHIRGNILSHNHPSNSSFTYQEILGAADLNVNESRIITLDWIYSIKPLNQIWPSREIIERENENINSDLNLDFCITQPQFNPEWKHMRYEILSQRSGFVYSRTPWSHAGKNY